MGRIAKPVVLSREEREELKTIASSGTHEARLVQRAKIVLLCSDGIGIKRIAEKLDIRPNTVIVWRERYLGEGLDGLYDRDRPGKPVTYGEAFRNDVLQLLETPPPDGLAVWDGPTVAARLNVSKDAVWRLLRQEGICLSRQRSWCVSTDPEFVPKAADIIGLYLNPPANAIVLSVDEKPRMQALQRTTGYGGPAAAKSLAA